MKICRGSLFAYRGADFACREDPRAPEDKHSSPTASGDFFDKDRTVSSRIGMLTRFAFNITVSKINKATQSKASLCTREPWFRAVFQTTSSQGGLSVA